MYIYIYIYYYAVLLLLIYNNDTCHCSYEILKTNQNNKNIDQM